MRGDHPTLASPQANSRHKATDTSAMQLRLGFTTFCELYIDSCKIQRCHTKNIDIAQVTHKNIASIQLSEVAQRQVLSDK